VNTDSCEIHSQFTVDRPILCSVLCVALVLTLVYTMYVRLFYTRTHTSSGSVEISACRPLRNNNPPANLRFLVSNYTTVLSETRGVNPPLAYEALRHVFNSPPPTSLPVVGPGQRTQII